MFEKHANKPTVRRGIGWPIAAVAIAGLAAAFAFTEGSPHRFSSSPTVEEEPTLAAHAAVPAPQAAGHRELPSNLAATPPEVFVGEPAPASRSKPGVARRTDGAVDGRRRSHREKAVSATIDAMVAADAQPSEIEVTAENDAPQDGAQKTAAYVSMVDDMLNGFQAGLDGQSGQTGDPTP